MRLFRSNGKEKSREVWMGWKGEGRGGNRRGKGISSEDLVERNGREIWGKKEGGGKNGCQ